MKHELPLFLSVILLLMVVMLAQAKNEKREEKPPIIILSEESGRYSFRSGSAQIKEEFRQALWDTIIPLLDSLAQRYACDVIEVIGHTDGQPIQEQWDSNLDDSLLPFLNGEEEIQLMPGSNADLGLMRAVAVVRFLQEAKRQGYLRRIRRFYPLSAGQVILPNGEWADPDDRAPDAARRRIEIRLLRSR